MKQSEVVVPASPGWVRPDDVMRARKLKVKRHALQARMSSSARPLLVPSSAKSPSVIKAKRNPFRRSPAKKATTNVSTVDMDSTDATLFNLLHNPLLQSKPSLDSSSVCNFTQALRQQGIPTSQETKEPTTVWQDHLCVDWSLKTSLRFASDKPLPWKQNFKTCEEASGTTGMTRCLWSTKQSSELDTSPNTEFYQRCLVWQHPSLPGVNLFPRDSSKTANSLSRPTGPGSNSSSGSPAGPYAGLSVPLLGSWCEALRSLHQLVRVRQCPYFYVCAPSFTVLYRAAGVCGIPHAHALVTPTTRGLRRAMKEEGIEFKMPLCKQFSQSQGSETSLSSKSTSESSSCTSSPSSQSTDPSSTPETDTPQQSEDIVDDGEDATSFLENLGVDTSQFASLNPNRAQKSSLHEIDRSPLSIVYISDPDTHALTNFLLNSPSCVTHTGPLAGVPPTLLAPVAFQGATLLPYKVKGSSVRSEGRLQYSMEVTGPILPHTPLQLCSLLTQHLNNFTLTATPLTNSLSFSTCSPYLHASPIPKAFAEEGLIDCGLEACVRSIVCEHPVADGRVGQIEEQDQESSTLPPSYRQVKYEDEKFTWTDQLPSTSR